MINENILYFYAETPLHMVHNEANLNFIIFPGKHEGREVLLFRYRKWPLVV